MPLDGNGAFSPPAPQFPAIPNTIIYADDFNQIILDIATALSTAIFRDGQAAFTANQSMGGFKLVNLANGVNPQDAVTVLQVFTDPTFTGTTTDGVKVTGTKLTVTTTTVELPAGTSIGNVSAAELAYLDGVTSNLQAQLDGKVASASGTAANLTLTGIPTAPTAAPGTNTNQIATMAALINQAFSTALPNQSGNAGKYLSTDGVTGQWVDVPQYPITALSVI